MANTIDGIDPTFLSSQSFRPWESAPHPTQSAHRERSRGLGKGGKAGKRKGKYPRLKVLDRVPAKVGNGSPWLDRWHSRWETTGSSLCDVSAGGVGRIFTAIARHNVPAVQALVTARANLHVRGYWICQYTRELQFFLMLPCLCCQPGPGYIRNLYTASQCSEA